MNISPEFISIGGNRNPAAADWEEGGHGLLAFGADNSIALWDPLVSTHRTPFVMIISETKHATRMIIFAAFACYSMVILKPLMR